MQQVPLLIVSGTVGVGKTTVGEAASELLESAQVPHAFVDLDALSYSWPRRGRFNIAMAFQNLASLWLNFRDAGAERLLVAAVVETVEGLDPFRRAVPGAEITVCRLMASEEERMARLVARDEGESLDWHLARTVELDEVFDRAALTEFLVRNEGRSRVEVAEEMLRTAGWLPVRGDSSASVV